MLSDLIDQLCFFLNLASIFCRLGQCSFAWGRLCLRFIRAVLHSAGFLVAKCVRGYRVFGGDDGVENVKKKNCMIDVRESNKG